MSTALTLSSLSLFNTNSLESYLAQVKKIPVLSVNEERTLAERFYQDKDLAAARQLIISNLRFVVYIAQGYTNYGLPMNDLIQEGNIGLMKAVKRFNPNMNVRLISFAVHWIKAEIQEFILCNWRLVKVATTKAKRKLFFNLRKTKKRLGWATTQEVKQVAEQLNVRSKDVKSMEVHLSSSDMMLGGAAEEYTPHIETAGSRVPMLAFSDSRYDPVTLLETNNLTESNTIFLEKALQFLDARGQDIIKRRWLQEPKAKLKELAMYYQLSIERIRQLEKIAIQTLRNVLGNTVQDALAH